MSKSVTVTFEGLNELRAALRQLPPALLTQANSIVQRRARNAEAGIRAVYAAHHQSGALERGLSLQAEHETYGLVVTVRSRANHAWLFEFGSQRGRLRQTRSGANRGASPPHATVVPIAARERRAMYVELTDLLRAHGFSIRGVL